MLMIVKLRTARKRVTIGVELASKPQLLLFLDEPTSGLDGQSAFNIVRFLRKVSSFLPFLVPARPDLSAASKARRRWSRSV